LFYLAASPSVCTLLHNRSLPRPLSIPGRPADGTCPCL